MALKACRHCHYLTREDQCPKCGSRDLSDEWFDLVIILNPKESRIAQTLNANYEGKYAIRVR